MKKGVKRLSIIVPCYNEEGTVEEIICRVLDASIQREVSREVIIVDDGSDDRSPEILKDLADRHDPVKAICRDENKGKGAALREGFKHAGGDVVLVQDADLEYDPDEYERLLRPILDGKADVVYGSRFRSGKEARVLYYWHRLGNIFLTQLSNMFTDLNLTDMETCYKVFRKRVLEKFQIEEDQFGFEPEITAKVASLHPDVRIYEVGISYHGRTYEEGKKIDWRDGLRAIYAILKYNIFR